MKQIKKLKIFISYSHKDKENIKEFRKHLAPLKNNGLIKDWYDRMIIAGQDFQEKIDNNLEDADIICLFISANFLSSDSCMKEKIQALELKKKKGIKVVFIILSACGWSDDNDISPLLVLPTDGKPISKFNNADDGWYDVYNGFKKVIEEENKIKQLKLTDEFSYFLQNTDLLTNAHSQKEKVFLDDIFVYPILEKYDVLREYEKKESSEDLIGNLCDYSKILIAGENQSGKTTLCKKIFTVLREKNFVPIYITDKDQQYQGKIENKITKAFNEQYQTIQINELDKKRLVPIIDDFHFAKNKEKHVIDLSSYAFQIVIVDDIFCLNLKDDNIIRSFTHFRITEFIPSLRNQLIKKWIHLTEKKKEIKHNENEIYQEIDNKFELVNTALGKVIGSGIMPAYPFFILSIISNYETLAKPLQEITSQGYCYEALIFMYLTKLGVKSDEIDSYINFLSVFAFYFYKEKKNELSNNEFEDFMKSYLEKYNLPIEQETLFKNLRQTQIIALNNFNNFTFCYSYLYYFFVAKYIADHIENNKNIIDSIISNLHKDENAYIAIFISHHSKNIYILDKLINNSQSLFNKYREATLSNNELDFFDKEADNIIEAVLPQTNITPEKERAERLKNQDEEEQINKNEIKNNIHDEENDDELAMELRKSVKTVEVMGRIIKNRAGSLEKNKLEEIFEKAMKIHLRILTSFFHLIKKDEQQQAIVDFISNRLNKINDENEKESKEKNEKSKPLSQEKLEKMSKIIFWNMNFFVIFGFINKIIHSLGSNKLTSIIEKVCDNEGTPASYLVKHGILMWYNKNLQTENIAKKINEDNFSETAKKVMRFMIVNHCSMHKVKFDEKQKIENKFGISTQKLLIQQIKRSEQE